jgi:hypothetical protein
MVNQTEKNYIYEMEYYDKDINGNIIKKIMEILLSKKIEKDLIDIKYIWILKQYINFKLHRIIPYGIEASMAYSLTEDEIMLINYYRVLLIKSSRDLIKIKSFDINVVPSFEELKNEKLLNELIG